eukprot:m.79030 g.79030  ORF g.79030 m.79030 type:complete len:600 (-) comp8590_c0_seq4:1794-3593(-)
MSEEDSATLLSNVDRVSNVVFEAFDKMSFEDGTQRGNMLALLRDFRMACEVIILSDPVAANDASISERMFKVGLHRMISLYRKRSQVRAKAPKEFTAFLSEGSGFIINLIQQLDARYNLNLHAHSSLPLYFNNSKSAVNEDSNVLSIVYEIVFRFEINCGDLARYAALHYASLKQFGAASASYSLSKKHYKDALFVFPNKGMPFNQLAVTATRENNLFDAGYFYIRSVTAVEKFGPAEENFALLRSMISNKAHNVLDPDEDDAVDSDGLSVQSVTETLLQFAFIHVYLLHNVLDDHIEDLRLWERWKDRNGWFFGRLAQAISIFASMAYEIEQRQQYIQSQNVITANVDEETKKQLVDKFGMRTMLHIIVYCIFSTSFHQEKSSQQSDLRPVEAVEFTLDCLFFMMNSYQEYPSKSILSAINVLLFWLSETNTILSSLTPTAEDSPLLPSHKLWSLLTDLHSTLSSSTMSSFSSKMSKEELLLQCNALDEFQYFRGCALLHMEQENPHHQSQPILNAEQAHSLRCELLVSSLSNLHSSDFLHEYLESQDEQNAAPEWQMKIEGNDNDDERILDADVQHLLGTCFDVVSCVESGLNNESF